MFWTVDPGDCLDGLVECKGYKRNRWRRRQNRKKEEVEEEEMEDWEREEMAAMWRFQGECDAATSQQLCASSIIDLGIDQAGAELLDLQLVDPAVVKVEQLDVDV